MRTETSGSMTVEYDEMSVNPVTARDMVEIAYRESIPYPNDFFFNIAYPHETFYLTKYSDEIGYRITFRGYRHVPDPYLEYTRNLHQSLEKKGYRVSIVFLASDGKITFEYSDRNYRKELLKNNLFVMLAIPVVTVLTLILLNYLSGLAVSKVDSPALLNVIQQLLPLLCYPMSILAFKSLPLIPLTKMTNGFIMILSVFMYYISTGNGLVGSLILLAIFVLNSIQNSL